MINNTELPNKSILKIDGTRYHYMDSFQREFDNKKRTIRLIEIAKLFVSSTPNWSRKLLRIRNNLVRWLGLKTPTGVSEGQNRLENFKCEPGDQLGVFKVFTKTNNEVVLGEDDKHLNFRVSLLVDQSTSNSNKMTLAISTIVIFNNWFGRLYFFLIKPFHKLIVPAMLNRMIGNLEGKNDERQKISE